MSTNETDMPTIPLHTKLRQCILPDNSKRWMVLQLGGRVMRHPVRFFSSMSTQRVRNFISSIKQGNLKYAASRTWECMAIDIIEAQALYKLDLVENPEATAADFVPFSMPVSDKPLVSIIIPVYNQFAYTYNCLKSIADNSGNVAYEVLIANDCSTDLTRELTDIVSGPRMINNTENLRFLKNCNHAAQFAKGQYILFLNNDTQVQPGWLESLVQLISSADDIGMVGSKLLYPDGRLQEAGGIVWKDGSAWNYGNKKDPALPEFNYVKETDYISGAAIMIKTALWQQLGGFDERFAPAYYEDTDLAFQVRATGYRVMFQPASVVIHFVGISNGTDTNSGLQAYQVENQKRFVEKWHDVLEKEHFENAQHVFLACDRSAKKKHLLMIDHYVPTFDKDAGSRAMYSYLRMFVAQGYQITFIGDDFMALKPYTAILQQLGIHVVYGSHYRNWRLWLKENCSYFDYAILSRPHIAPKWLEDVRQNSKAKIIYFGHDLAFLREKREYDVTGNASFLRSSEQWKEKELSLMRKADVSYYFSPVEEALIHEIDPSIAIRTVPLYQYENVADVPYDVPTRKDLMMVAGYNHRPNTDAAIWFAKEIFPKVQKAIPDIQLHIIGANAPTTVTDLAGNGIIYDGRVSDEELTAFYHSCRISVVPLRYGAGIKGKVLEAMSFGMPVVTTSVGAEGIVGSETILSVQDEADAFAQELIRLYQNGEELQQRNQSSTRFIRENFSTAAMVKILSADFDFHGQQA